jgi:hypothetical protein
MGAEVENLLAQFCSRHTEVGYCQGMHFLVEFLLKTLKTEKLVNLLLEHLMVEPYSLCELWRAGFPRLRATVSIVTVLT